MKNPFKLTSPEKAVGTSFQDEVRTSYARLVELFGYPNSKGDEYKISTEWVLENERGQIFTIYDWKSTELYEGGQMTIEELRTLSEYDWHIGAKINSGTLDLRRFIANK